MASSKSMGTLAKRACIWASESMARAGSMPMARKVRSGACAKRWACLQALERGKPKLAANTANVGYVFR